MDYQYDWVILEKRKLDSYQAVKEVFQLIKNNKFDVLYFIKY